MSLRVEHIVKTFGTKTAVNDLSFAMDEPGKMCIRDRKSMSF